MKAYGLPRVKDIEFPDVADIQTFGLNFSAGGQDYFKNKNKKASVRRYWKRKARKFNFEEEIWYDQENPEQSLLDSENWFKENNL